jgi:hypothetical protein
LSAKDIVKRMKGQTIDCVKIFAKDTSVIGTAVQNI